MTHLRPAIPGDCELYFEWANDAEVRRRSLQQGIIAWADHAAWFARKLADPDCRLFVWEVDGKPVGQIRIDRGDVSLSVLGSARGVGHGSAMLVAGVHRVFSETALCALTAYVKRDNPASVRIFQRAAFFDRGLIVFRREVS